MLEALLNEYSSKLLEDQSAKRNVDSRGQPHEISEMNKYYYRNYLWDTFVTF